MLAAAVLPPTAGAQRPSGGSVRVATDHWTNYYIGRLRERGFLPGLNPLVQPWRAADVARALSTLDPDTLSEPARGWVRLLRGHFAAPADGGPGARGGASALGGARASTSRRLDPTRPLGEEQAWPRYQVGGWFEAGPAAGELRLLGDTYFNDDPDGADPGQRRGARSDLAYLAVDFPIASLELGRLARNWSAFGSHGLMVSDVATPYPQLGLELRAWRVVLRGFTGELESINGQKRYFSAHRFDYETPRLVVSVGESMVYAEESGGLRLRFLNPVEFLFFDADNQPADAIQNLMLDVQVWARVGDVTVRGEAMLDDLDVSPPEGVDPAPARYAVTVASRWTPAGSRASVAGEYRQVASYGYRTNRVVDAYQYLGRGLAQNHADFDQLTVGLEYVPPVPGLALEARGRVVRQGEGDLRTPFGDYDAFRGARTLFLGIREDTYRVALAGRYQPFRFAWLAWDVGYNWIRNRNHVQDASENLFSAAAELGVRIDFPFRPGP